ncbi:unnamed protein product [Peniophora sp. CBMAI 1063]|nr:unnamed protein product [Peniophora sp. CBMAI 1063]
MQQPRNNLPLSQPQFPQQYQLNSMQPHRNQPDDGNYCFCGLPGHYLRNCMVAEEYIRTGRAMRNQHNDLVLPTGKYVPSIISGPNLKARINAWHHQNPLAGQQQQQQQQQNVSPQMMFATQHSLAPRPMYTNYAPNLSYTPTSAAPSLTQQFLSREQRLAHLRDKKAALERAAGQQAAYMQQPEDARRMNHATKRPQAQASRQDRADRRSVRFDVPGSSPKCERPPHMPREEASSMTAPPARNSATPKPETVTPAPETHTNMRNEMPEHSYANTRNPVYTPLQTRNVGAPPPKPTAPKCNEPAYRTQPPVYYAQAAQHVYERSMGTDMTLTHRELLSIAPKVHAKIREAVSSR